MGCFDAGELAVAVVGVAGGCFSADAHAGGLPVGVVGVADAAVGSCFAGQAVVCVVAQRVGPGAGVIDGGEVAFQAIPRS